MADADDVVVVGCELHVLGHVEAVSRRDHHQQRCERHHELGGGVAGAVDLVLGHRNRAQHELASGLRCAELHSAAVALLGVGHACGDAGSQILGPLVRFGVAGDGLFPALENRSQVPGVVQHRQPCHPAMEIRRRPELVVLLFSHHCYPSTR